MTVPMMRVGESLTGVPFLGVDAPSNDTDSLRCLEDPAAGCADLVTC
jgi:hypothetical protein